MTLAGLGGHLAELAAPAARYAARGPRAAAGLERTDRSPWRWVSAQALHSGVDPATLAAAVDRPGVSARALPGGLVAIDLTAELVDRLLGELGGPAADPGPAPLPPRDGLDAVRFEAARTSRGAPPLAAGLAHRRTLANPVVRVQLARARARRRLATRSPGRTPIAADADPATCRLATELLDAPRRLERVLTRPDETAAALLAVAAAYLDWAADHPPEVTLDAAAGRVLERGLARLGVSAPERM